MSKDAVKEPNPFAAGALAFEKGKDAHTANPYKAHQRHEKQRTESAPYG